MNMRMILVGVLIVVIILSLGIYSGSRIELSSIKNNILYIWK